MTRAEATSIVTTLMEALETQALPPADPVRDAIGDQPALRGGLLPDERAIDGETPGQSVQRAADWAVANAPACHAAPTTSVR